MSAGSIAVVVVLFALVGLAIWRGYRKGMPCSCGCDRDECSCGCGKEPAKKGGTPHCCCGDDMA